VSPTVKNYGMKRSSTSFFRNISKEE